MNPSPKGKNGGCGKGNKITRQTTYAQRAGGIKGHACQGSYNHECGTMGDGGKRDGEGGSP